MTEDLSVHELWDSAPFGERAFRAADLSRLPEAA